MADEAAPRANNMAELQQRRVMRPIVHADSLSKRRASAKNPMKPGFPACRLARQYRQFVPLAADFSAPGVVPGRIAPGRSPCYAEPFRTSVPFGKAHMSSQFASRPLVIAPSMPIYTNFAGGYIMNWQPGNFDYPGYIGATDWVSSGTYPISGWNRPDDLDVSGRTLDRFENLSNGAPQFAIIESSDQLGSWTAPGSPGPNAQQVRAETWDAIIHGAKGIIYFPQSLTPTFNYDNTPPDIAAEITTQNARITSIGQALVSQIDPPTLGFTGGAPLEATWRVFNGQKYYVVLNMSAQTLTNQTMLSISSTATTSAAFARAI